MKTKFILILTLLLMANTAWSLSLDEATKMALGNSHELKAMRLEQESAEWAEVKAKSGYMPKLDLNARHLFSEHFEELELEFGGGTFTMPAIQPYTSFGVSASVEIFSGLRTVNEVEAARLARDVSRQQLARATESARVNIRTLFYRALGAQTLVEVADQNIKTLESHLVDVNARVRTGVSMRFDALRSEVQLEDARTEKVQAEDNVATARAKLFQALNVADDGKPLEGQLPEDFANISRELAKTQEVARADRVAKALSVQRSESLAKAARAHWMPRVSLFGDHEWYNNCNHSIIDSDERFKSASSFGILLKWNLFDGGAALASQRQAMLAQEIAAEQLAQLDRAVPVELEESKRRLSYDIINYRAKVSSVRKAEEAVRLAKSGMKVGTRTNTEVLDAVVDLNRARAASLKSQVDAIDALGQLELALGRPLI